MYLMYVDESGDPGNNTKQTRFFCLSGIVVHESRWRSFIDANIAFRRRMNDFYGLPLRQELHAVKMLRHNKFGIAKHDRLAILRNYLDELAKLDHIMITNVVVDKQGKPVDFPIFDVAWRTLFQRFENTMTHGNFPGGHSKSFGTVFTDATAGEQLSRIMRKMSVFNPIPNTFGGGTRNLPICRIIEDPSPRDSKSSLPIQACDTVAYFLQQSLAPNVYMKKKGAQNYFKRLKPVLNLNASGKDALGVVHL